jgi:tetratricopeptide (TPR) repeat protein
MQPEFRNTMQQLHRLVATGHRSEAAELLKSLASDPEFPNAHRLQAANAALYIGECSVAIALARAYAKASGQEPLRAVQAGGVLAQAGKLEEARAVVESQLDKFADHPSVNHFLGTVCQQLGELPVAERHLLAGLDAYKVSGITWLTLAAQHDFRRDDPLLQRMLDLRAELDRCDPDRSVPFQFALGKALLDVGEIEGALDAFQQGASGSKESSRYDPERDLRDVARIVDENTREDLDRVPVKRERTAGIIFVVGMPRSGTTLLQRLLVTSGGVAGGGEFAGMGVATMDFRRRGLDTAKALADLGDRGAEAAQQFAKIYRYLVRERFGGQGIFVDKSIRNTQFAGLFALAFPNSPIVVIERDPVDVAWSCFRTFFSQGQFWSWKPEHIANHIRAEAQLIEHWKKVLPDQIISVRYEDIVRKPLQSLPTVFEWCGIEFDEEVLQFHERHAGAVTTASVAQVSRPLYTDSIGVPQTVLDRLGQDITRLRELQVSR